MSDDSQFSNAKIVAANYSLKAYLAQPAKRGEPGFVMHSSAIRAFLKNPQKWLLVGEDEAIAQADAEEKGEEAVKAATKAQAWGSLVDCLFTTPDEFETRYVMTPDTYEDSKGQEAEWTWKSSTCRAWRDKKLAQGLEVVTPDEHEKAQTAADRFRADPEIMALVAGAQFQVFVTADYTDPITQLVVPLKTLIDVVPAKDGPYGRALANLKTTNDGSYRKWRNIIEDHGLDIQGALEYDIYNAARPEERRAFYYHPIQEQKPPYVIGRRKLGQDGYLQTGRKQYRDALALYCLCLKHKTWPGYDDAFPGQTVINTDDKWTLVEPSPWHLQRNL